MQGLVKALGRLFAMALLVVPMARPTPSMNGRGRPEGMLCPGASVLLCSL